MQSIGKVFKKTRTTMIESTVDSVSQEFQKRFGLKEGDYLKFNRPLWGETPGRILSIEEVFFNQKNGYTAVVMIVPMLKRGGLGTGMRLTICVNANGTGLRGVGKEVVTRFAQEN